MRQRMHAALFAVVCLVGAASATALAVAEAVRTPAVTVHVTHKERAGLTTTVDVAVHNTTGTARCVVVRVAARDRDGHDLGRAVVPPLSLAPHQRARVTTRVTLSARQYAEKLSQFVPSVRACGT